jgi:hypothetical protein
VRRTIRVIGIGLFLLTLGYSVKLPRFPDHRVADGADRAATVLHSGYPYAAIPSRAKKDSTLARWYRTRTEGPSGARKTTMIAALARKLLIALWRLVTTGEVPVALRPAPGATLSRTRKDKQGSAPDCRLMRRVADDDPRWRQCASGYGCNAAESMNPPPRSLARRSV